MIPTKSVGLDAAAATSTPAFSLARRRLSERAVLTFFVYTAILAFFHDLPLWKKLVSAAIPCVLFAWVAAETSWSRHATGIVRDWCIPLAVLGGYWQMAWFATGHTSPWQRTWIGWDRALLDGWGLRGWIESAGSAIPWTLEFCYLCLYAIPPVCIAILYWHRAWLRTDRFLVTFAVGTLAVYALLPLIPVQSPRLAFAGQDLPHVQTLWRAVNVWVLDRLDISTSVFPSGHVAVAFSSAFGLKRALPERPGMFIAILAVAAAVFAATVYGRYHYAIDGIASIGVCLAAWGACEAYERAA